MGLVQRHATSPRAICARVAALGLALAAMLAQVGSYAHLAATRHVTCAEHGELVDAGHLAAPTGAAVDRAESRYIAVERDATHGHEHCAVAPHRRARAIHEVVRSAVAAVAPARIGRSAVDVAPPRAIDLIRLAPKGSPPTA